MVEHKGPDVSQRRRKRNGEFDNEDAKRKPVSLPAKARDEMDDLLDQCEEAQVGGEDDLLRLYDEYTVNRLEQISNLTDEEINNRYPVDDTVQTELAKTIEEQRAATIELVKQSRERLAEYRQEEQTKLDECDKRYWEKTSQPIQQQLDNLAGQDNPRRFIRSQRYLNSIHEYKPEQYWAITAFDTKIDKVEPYKYRGSTRYRVNYTTSKGLKGKVTFPADAMDLTGEQQDRAQHAKELLTMTWADRCLQRGLDDPDFMYPGHGWPDYRYTDDRKLPFDESGPLSVKVNELNSKRNELEEKIFKTEKTRRANEESRKHVNMKRDEARTCLAFYRQTKDMTMIRPGNDSDRQLVENMPQLHDSVKCDLRGVSADRQTFLLEHHSDRNAEYSELGYTPDIKTLGLVHRDGTPVLGENGKPLVMRTSRFMHPMD
ncbi:hypothetical protein [Bifidobacterium callitrichidarum]|uniref:Uncharacterized protein n=1 Tax=Bifidobacterium callitrichidarum TaxID=2052941 RepID=A0A2U2N919_9BIFI|nr:hypothetical protein [Bifidobacterium callitrichidarum]PWG65661.1 hypothetical protein DF196_06935 [Bifidobacterium callitrichidarum]